MRIRYITSSTKADIRPPFESSDVTLISDLYNELMLELFQDGATVISTREEVIDGYHTIVRKFDNDVEVHIVPNTTKVQ